MNLAASAIASKQSAEGAPHTSLGCNPRYTPASKRKSAESATHRYLAGLLLFTLSLIALGCHTTPPTTPKPTTATATYPTRPTTPALPFKLFHAANGTFTLVTTPTASDEQIEAILYQLRDAAHTNTFDRLHIPQKTVDARAPTVWFHLYRGPRCAAEKYAPGAPPCGPSYHAAGDYTFGSYKPRDWDEGTLIHDEDHQTELWPAGSPYTAANVTH